MHEVSRTIISQFATSPVLTSLIHSINDSIDPRANLEEFYEFIWNVDTAVGYGLDVWGRIVGVNRVIPVVTGQFFGFAEAADPLESGFDLYAFYNGVETTGNFTLTDDAFRLLIFAKAATNITNGSIQAINAILMNLFPNRGNCYVTDGQNIPEKPYFGFAMGKRTEEFQFAEAIGIGFNQAPFHFVATQDYVAALSDPNCIDRIEGDFFGFAEAADPDDMGFGQAPFFAINHYGSQFLPVPGCIDLTPSGIYLGFAEAEDPNMTGFGQGDLYSFQDASLVEEGAAVDLNPLVTGFNQAQFGDFEPRAPDNMTMEYVFEFPLQPFEYSIVAFSGALPKSTGVKASVVVPLP